MKNKKVVWIIVVICIFLGLILATIGLVTGENKGIYFDHTGIHKIGKESKEEKQFNIEPITQIYIDVTDFNILFEEADNYGIEIKTYEDSNTIEWNIQNGILNVTEKEHSKFRIFSFDFSFLEKESSPYIKIYLPKEKEIEILQIKNRNSDIHLDNFKIGELEIKNIYGRVNLEDLESSNIQIEMKNGDLKLKDIRAEKISLECKYGAIQGEGVDTINSNIKNENGNIKIQGDFSGNTEINSTYGNVELELEKEKLYYHMDLSTKYGNIILNKRKLEDKNYKENWEREKELKITVKNGDINIRFKEDV